MSDNYPIHLNKASQSGDVTTIESPSLVKGLIKNSSQTISLLSSTYSPISLDHISIDDQGRIVVKDQSFGDAVAAVGNSAGNNCAC